MENADNRVANFVVTAFYFVVLVKQKTKQQSNFVSAKKKIPLLDSVSKQVPLGRGACLVNPGRTNHFLRHTARHRPEFGHSFFH